MKIHSLILFLIFLSIGKDSTAQVYKDSWSFGFGAAYPRMISLWEGAYSGIDNYGGFLYLQRNFSEHVGTRLSADFLHMETNYSGGGIQSNNQIGANLDLLYYFVPCEDVTPYLSTGMGAIFFSLDNSYESHLDVTYAEYEYNLGLGVKVNLSDKWSITGEGVYHTTSTNKLDGADTPGADKGLFGGNSDTYITFNFGFNYIFSAGKPSTACDLYQGVTAGAPDYSLEEIEELIKKYMPKEVVKEVIVGAPQKETTWVLVGVNFEYNSAKLNSSSYPMLLNAIQFLNQNPEMIVEIQGHTDNVGSDEYNLQLSEKRAQTVKDYLVSKGISAGRLQVKGYGESSPVADNSTADGRELNRRIEFKILEN
jgi:OOP family OmpA-OmpF porin